MKERDSWVELGVGGVLCLVDRVSLYNLLNKANLVHNFLSILIYFLYMFRARDKWVPVTTALRVLRLRMEERPSIWRVAANILNKQSQTADEGWSSSLGVGRGANNASP